jgi:hypothetical protein
MRWLLHCPWLKKMMSAGLQTIPNEEEPTMATRVRWLGHACLFIESDGQRLIIDPFLTGNPAAACKPDDVEADFILISHGPCRPRRRCH